MNPGILGPRVPCPIFLLSQHRPAVAHVDKLTRMLDYLLKEVRPAAPQVRGAALPERLRQAVGRHGEAAPLRGGRAGSGSS